MKGAIGNVSHNPFPIIPKIDVTSLSFLKKLSDETVLHLFYKCNIILNLRNELDLFFENEFTLFDLTPQAAFLGFLNVDSKLLLIQNHLLLIFKIYIYNSRRSESLKIKSLIREITKVKNIEEKISLNNEKKHAIYKRKWQLVENVLKTFLKTLKAFYLIQSLNRGAGG